MSSETAYFLSRDGLRLYYHHWQVMDPKGIVCLVHSLGEHSYRYQHFAHRMAEAGITVFGLDLRGHGLSQGKKGHAPGYDLLLSDIEELLKTARAEYTDLPMFLFGHGMGGNLVANYVIRMNTNELAGYILSAPWLRLSEKKQKKVSRITRIIAKLLPAVTHTTSVDASKLSNDPESIQSYQTDPLIHRSVSASLYLAYLDAGEDALRRASEPKLKGLIIQGDADPVVESKASELFARTAPNAEWHALNGVLHDPLNDTVRDQVTDLIINWMGF